jgi:hypothetical protein
MSAIGTFLHEVASEAQRRGYNFDVRKIARSRGAERIRETRGQLEYEWVHLRQKLEVRAPAIACRLCDVEKAQAHPLFRIIAGGVRGWEKGKTVESRVRPSYGSVQSVGWEISAKDERR